MCVVMSLLSSTVLLSTPPRYHVKTDTATSLFPALQFNRPTISTHNRRENNLFQSTRGTRQIQKLIKLHDAVAQYSHLSPPLSDGHQYSSSEIIVHQTGEICHRYLFCNLETRGDKVLALPAPLCRLVSGRGSGRGTQSLVQWQ